VPVRRVVVLLLMFGMPATSSAAPLSTDDEYDIAFLKQHGVSDNLDGLLAYLKDRTLDDAKIKRIRELITETGHARFAVRERAAKELLQYGMSALRFLDEARQDKDPEVADRAARLIEQIKGGPGSSLPIAVLRQVRRINSADAVVVVMKYLPFADDTMVDDEALQTLLKIALQEGKPDPRIREFLKDSFPARRAAVGYIIGRARADADVEAARKLLADADPWVRLRTAQGMIACENRDGVPALIKLVEPQVEEITWRAEDLLRRIARDESPSSPTDDKPASRKAYVAAWDAWWAKNSKTAGLALANELPLLNLWLGIEYNTNSVWECTRDGKRLWTITAQGPMDAQVLPGNRVLIAEQEAKRVTERDFKGNIIWEYTTTEDTINCKRLPNGNTWIGTRYTVMEVRPDKTVVYSHRLSEQYMHAVRRLSNGGAVGITSTGVIHEMNADGKKVRGANVPHEGTWGDVDVLPNGNYLVSNYANGFVREVDQTGKTIRQVKTSPATGVERLPNGQLLVSGGELAQIIDWNGRVQWSTKSNGSIRRIHLR
jgi:hypothetical protein